MAEFGCGCAILTTNGYVLVYMTLKDGADGGRVCRFWFAGFRGIGINAELDDGDASPTPTPEP